jgi:hypothetical protein
MHPIIAACATAGFLSLIIGFMAGVVSSRIHGGQMHVLKHIGRLAVLVLVVAFSIGAYFELLEVYWQRLRPQDGTMTPVSSIDTLPLLVVIIVSMVSFIVGLAVVRERRRA